MIGTHQRRCYSCGLDFFVEAGNSTDCPACHSVTSVPQAVSERGSIPLGGASGAEQAASHLQWKRANEPTRFQTGLRDNVTPETILRIADEHPVLSSVVKAWRMGAFSWEQAMMTAAAYLADQNSRLMQDAVKLELMKIPDPIEVNG